MVVQANRYVYTYHDHIPLNFFRFSFYYEKHKVSNSENRDEEGKHGYDEHFYTLCSTLATLEVFTGI